MKRSMMEWFSAKVAMRTTLEICVAGSLLVLPISSSFAAEKPKTEVADLRYGVALYHYYQQDYIPAITELMVADARDGIQGHGNNPELIAGGLSLAFGMQNHAEQLFTQLLQDTSRPQNVRDAAWFYLGKLQYAKADWAGAASSFSRVSDKFNSDLLAEMHSLQINLQIKQNDLAPFSIKKIEQDKLSQWEPYALYNLGAANARNGDLKTAKEFFNELTAISFDGSGQSRIEYLTLMDKAHTAIGYTYLQDKSYSAAIEEFRKVRLDGMESNQALLGYGWAAIAQEKYAEAIRPWQVLQQRSLLFPAAQEALLALPFAYEKLNAPGDALREYEHAEALLAQEIDLVRDMRETLTAGELLTLVSSKPVSATMLQELEKKNEPGTLTALITDDGQNWLKLSGTSVIKTRSIYLRELFAQNDFQSAVLDLRDLLKLQKILLDWQPKLTSYTELLHQKQNWRQQKEQQVSQQSLVQKQVDMQKERDALAKRIATVKSNNDYIALADPQTRKLFAAVERSTATIERMKSAGQDTTEYENRLWVSRGILLWRAAQDFPANLAALEASLAEMDAAITATKLSHEKIASVIATGQDLQPLFARIQTQQAQVEKQLLDLNKVIDARSEKLRSKVDAQLNAHEKRLNRYLAQSHLAVARLYDAALRKQAQ
ncbi:tetratricopeptide repeat protein [Cellvibrio zantedeschiae]|nr:tetratricopeptide repeat protein [Cellvibrio zantedeschiae]